LKLFFGDFSEEEMLRAKNQLKSFVFTNLESRSVLCDDIGRQVLSTGKRESTQEICQKIDDVTVEQIKASAKNSLLTNPTLVVYGPSINQELWSQNYAAVQNYFQANLR